MKNVNLTRIEKKKNKIIDKDAHIQKHVIIQPVVSQYA